MQFGEWISAMVAPVIEACLIPYQRCRQSRHELTHRTRHATLMMEVGEDMKTETESTTSDPDATTGDGVAATTTTTTSLPTVPCSVVWSGGHAYVLEPVQGRPRWLGVDDRGRAEELSGADLQRRGWTRTHAR